MERAREGGPVLRLVPRWAGITWWALLAMVLAALAFLVLARAGEYVSGPGVIRAAGSAPVAARAAGTVEDVLVRAGDRVLPGEALVRLWAGVEELELSRATAEFEVHLARLLLDPGDSSARTAAGAARPAVDFAHMRVAARTVRSPRAGRIGEIRVRPGQGVLAGEPLLFVGGEALGSANGLELVALLPGQVRPHLFDGIPLRLEVTGHSHVSLEVRAHPLSRCIFGPAAARRFLGDDVVDAVPLPGPVTAWRAPLPGTFEVDGRQWRLFAGMWVTAEARIRDEPLLFALVPGLRAAAERFR